MTISTEREFGIPKVAKNNISEVKNSRPKTNKSIEQHECSHALKSLEVDQGAILNFTSISQWFSKNGLNIHDQAYKNIFSEYRKNEGAKITLEDFDSAYYLHGDLF